MDPRTRRRLILYGLGAVIVAGLGYIGFVYVDQVEPDLGQLIGSAEACANYGDPDVGIEWAERGLKADPDHRYLHIILARCYERKEEYDRAAEYFERAVELTPEDDDQRGLLSLYRVEALWADGQEDEAMAAAKAVTVQFPDLLPGWYSLGRLHLRKDAFPEAEAAFREAGSRAPGDFEPVGLLAAVAEHAGDDDRALQLYRKAKALAADPSREAMVELRGSTPNPENQARLEELGTLLTKHAEIELGLARLYMKRNAPDEAEEHLLEAARLRPRTTRQALRTEPLFTPVKESERLRAILTGTVPADGSKN